MPKAGGVAYVIRGEDKKRFDGDENCPMRLPPGIAPTIPEPPIPEGTPNRGDLLRIIPLDPSKPSRAGGIKAYEGSGIIDIPEGANVSNIRIQLMPTIQIERKR